MMGRRPRDDEINIAETVIPFAGRYPDTCFMVYKVDPLFNRGVNPQAVMQSPIAATALLEHPSRLVFGVGLVASSAIALASA